MPIYEYRSRDCRGPEDCPRRFAFWQGMHDPPIAACMICRAPLERILSSFPPGVDLTADGGEGSLPPNGFAAPPATITNLFGGGLGIAGCGHGCSPSSDDHAGSEAS